MHEWALADGIVRTVQDFARKYNATRVNEVKIVLGELQDVDPEILKFALEETKKGTVMEDANLVFVEEKAVFECKNCGHRWYLDDVRDILDDKIKEDVHFVPEVAHAFISCPNCKSRDFEILEGRGVYIDSITIEED